MPALANLQHQLEGWGQRPAPQRVAAAAACLAAAASLAAALPRLPQPESYHSFAGDHRSLPGIPHAPNVLSNAAIAAAGVLGLAHLWRRWAGGSGRVRARRAAPAALAAEPAAARKSEDEASAEQEAANRAAAGFGGSPGKARLWAVAFAGMVAAGAGSAYYHWAPSTPRLAADQLGMSLAFAWLALAVVVDRRGPPRRALGWAAAAAGATAAPAAALHWLHSELAGAGNLRWYGLAQALTVVVIAYTALCYHPRGWRPTTTTRGLLTTLALYGAAMMGDRLDRPVYWLTGSLVSGHTVKHLLAGAASWQVVRMLQSTAAGGIECGK